MGFKASYKADNFVLEAF